MRKPCSSKPTKRTPHWFLPFLRREGLTLALRARVLLLLTPPERVAATLLAAKPATRASALVSLEEPQAAELVASLPSEKRGAVLLELAEGASATLKRRDEAERARALFREQWNDSESLHPLQRKAWSGMEGDGAELWPGARSATLPTTHYPLPATLPTTTLQPTHHYPLPVPACMSLSYVSHAATFIIRLLRP